MVSCKLGLRPSLAISKYLMISPNDAQIGSTVWMVRWILVAVRVLLVIYVFIHLWSVIIKSNANFVFLVRISFSEGLTIVNLLTELYWQCTGTLTTKRSLKLLAFYSRSLTAEGFSCYGIALVALSIPTFVVVPFLTGYLSKMPYFTLSVFFISALYNVANVAQFITFIEGIIRYFQKVNDEAHKAENLETCMHMHAELCELLRTINRTYNFQLLPTFGELLLVVTTMGYQMFTLISVGDPYQG